MQFHLCLANTLEPHCNTGFGVHRKSVNIILWLNGVIPEQFTVKAHPALFEEEGVIYKNEALLFQSTADIHFQNAHKTLFQSTVDKHFQNMHKAHKNCKG